MASTRLHKTYGQDADSKTKLTFSAWIKRSKIGATQDVFSAFRASDGYQTDIIRFGSDDRFEFWSFLSSGTSSVKTNKLFRDTSAWYHIVVCVDTSQATDSNRVKIYVNGVQETSFSTSTYPGQNTTLVPFGIGTGVEHTVGAVSTSNYFDGYLSHLHYTDGYAYAASTFGETDSNGVWKIKTSPSVSYGTNGFFLLKNDNSANDQSGEGNNYTATGTITNMKDNPSNVFATLNPLLEYAGNCTFSNGNNYVQTGAGSRDTLFSTIGVSSGKYYAEFKYVAGTAPRMDVGINGDPSEISRSVVPIGNGSTGYSFDGESAVKVNNGSSGGSYGSAISTGDIVMLAVDFDNLKIYFGKNGTWFDSGDPTSGSTGTGAAYTITAPASTPSGFYHFGVSDHSTGYNQTFASNFGNGYFGTTAVASAGTNASGNGVFEYDVPTGYTALCTKGLNGE